MNCHEVKPIHGHGLCVNCYRSDARAHDREEDTQASSKEQRKKVDTAHVIHASILRGLSKKGLPQRIIDEVRVIIRPYFSEVDYLFRGLDTAQPEPTDDQPQQSAEARQAVSEMVPDLDRLSVPEQRLKDEIAAMLKEDPAETPAPEPFEIDEW
jgi:hypothetical protein